MAKLAVAAGLTLFQGLAVVLIVVTLVFGASRATGADPITLSAPSDTTPEELDRLKDAAGLNDPLWEQYVRFLGDAARGDLGTSFRTGQPALEEVRIRLPKTIQLAAAALSISIVVGVTTGVIAAVRKGGVIDYVTRGLALGGQATPSFWLGLILMYFFSVRLGWLPTGGVGSWKHLILPALTLSAGSTAAVARLTRSGMLDVLGSDFIRTARAKGLAEHRVILRHALRHTLLPVVTVLGLQTGRLLAGAIIVETVFAWPGIGRLIINSITNSDYPVVQAGVIFIAVAIVTTNLVVDLTYRFIDPRTRLGGAH